MGNGAKRVGTGNSGGGDGSSRQSSSRWVGTGRSGQKDGSASACSFYSPGGIAIDSGRQCLWVAEKWSKKIRRVELSDGTSRCHSICCAMLLRGRCTICIPSSV